MAKNILERLLDYFLKLIRTALCERDKCCKLTIAKCAGHRMHVLQLELD